MADSAETPAGSSAYTLNLGPINLATTRAPAWLARAMVNSGAGDLLRRYRRA